jgi:glutaminase
MKITLSQLKRIIKEEVVNSKRALTTRKNRALKEYITSAGDVNEQLEAAVVAYLEKMMAKGMQLDEAHELLINEVEGSFEMFSVSLENDPL